jgi:predicted Ser/Thr protein kinase
LAGEADEISQFGRNQRATAGSKGIAMNTIATEPTAGRCQRCQSAVPVDAALGHCPRCLVELALRPVSGAGSSGGIAADPAPEPAALQPQFPGYEIDVLLGMGGAGFVYRARHLGLDRLVALKVLRPSLAKDPAFAERFEREARALASLDHRGIVGIHDFGRAGDWFYLTLEYIEGASLRDLLTTGRLGLRDVLALVPQLCDALQYAHDHRVVHRDIKPENILVGEDGRVCIADFGLAKLLGQGPEIGLTQSRTAVGTPIYMAPEQVLGAVAVDHRADVYSLGVVIYEMLTGTLPIGRFSPPSVHGGGSPAIDPVVLKSLENDPMRRFQQVDDVKQALLAAGKRAHTKLSRWRRRGWQQIESRHVLVPILFAVIAFLALPSAFAWSVLLVFVIVIGATEARTLIGRRPTRRGGPPPRGESGPWGYWLGLLVVFLALRMPWLRRQGDPGWHRVVDGNPAHDHPWLGFAVDHLGWLALLIGALATLRSIGVAVARPLLLAPAAVGVAAAGTFVVLGYASGFDAGAGAWLTWLVFVLWLTMEVAGHDGAPIWSHRRQPNLAK